MYLLADRAEATRRRRVHHQRLAAPAEQYAALRQAIENWRELRATLREMQALSRQLIFTTLPDTTRRKRLAKRVLAFSNRHSGLTRMADTSILLLMDISSATYIGFKFKESGTTGTGTPPVAPPAGEIKG